jgi:hypothetical protein
MRSDEQERYSVRLEDLLRLRAMQDRQVSAAVLRKEWDYAHQLATKAAEIDQAIHKLMLHGNERAQDGFQPPSAATG